MIDSALQNILKDESELPMIESVQISAEVESFISSIWDRGNYSAECKRFLGRILDGGCVTGEILAQKYSSLFYA